jgi:hypothetical protein
MADVRRAVRDALALAFPHARDGVRRDPSCGAPGGWVVPDDAPLVLLALSGGPDSLALAESPNMFRDNHLGNIDPARVATMAGADLLILLSDIDGLYTAPPNTNPEATLIPVVPRITAEIESMAGGAGSELSRGGMRTKIEAAKIATSGGTHMIIADGRVDNPLGAIASGKPCTWFLTGSNPVSARKTWIAGVLEPKGVLRVTCSNSCSSVGRRSASSADRSGEFSHRLRLASSVKRSTEIHTPPDAPGASRSPLR